MGREPLPDPLPPPPEMKEQEVGLWLPVRFGKQAVSSSARRADFLCTCVNTVQDRGHEHARCVFVPDRFRFPEPDLSHL